MARSWNFPDYPSNWSEISRVVKQRDGYRCRYCGSSGGILHVHHITSLSKGGSNNYSNLITLCEECHAKQHPHMQRGANYFNNRSYDNYQQLLLHVKMRQEINRRTKRIFLLIVSFPFLLCLAEYILSDTKITGVAVIIVAISIMIYVLAKKGSKNVEHVRKDFQKMTKWMIGSMSIGLSKNSKLSRFQKLVLGELAIISFLLILLVLSIIYKSLAVYR